MGRPAGVNGADTRRAVRKAAIERIWRHGFEAMNLRDLAADVNLRLGSLYNHVPHKQEFLAELLEEIMLELLQDFAQRMDGLQDAKERLLAFVRFHIEWHTARQRETFIGNMELRSLTPEQYGRVIGLRKDYEAQVRAIVADGRKAGLWEVDDVRVTTLALLSLLTGISAWYREGGRLSQERLIRIYQRLALRVLGAR
ncbi:TetR family transcriptional regulator [Ramlibacter tataouinensis]|uniref:TetR/AcrR family transcriptional regulator n=1 Tax=Ramlibacter tataouinensis TaxID=94132 RepID=UPI0022F3BB09|nr:TetR/AcrR family transcriptional regulator C-terminal domain-containing protein [Ramlibacter tataouinensis]WBY02820.1 TetR family transcriptional regulator [Ramlibacter tataouinensis]